LLLSIGSFPVDKIPEALGYFESTTSTVKDMFPRLGSVLQMPHNFSDRQRVILHQKLRKLNLEVMNTFFADIIGFCSEK
jgi:hypothetical protein